MKMFMRGLGYLALLAGVILPAIALGATDFGQIGENVGGMAEGLSRGAYNLFLFGGLVMAGIGVIMIGAANQRHESPKTGVVMLIGGILLSSILFLMSSGSQTLFGSDESQIQRELGL